MNVAAPTSQDLRIRASINSPIADLVPGWFDPGREDGRLRLHVGGAFPRAGWKILNIQPGPRVDFVDNCCDLSRFATGSVSTIYASHVLEHLGFREALPRALIEIRRVLNPGGPFLMSVPDLAVLSRLFLDERLDAQERMTAMMMMFGGQIDEHDFHHVGLYREFVADLLAGVGFKTVHQVARLGIFPDSSDAMLHGQSISLNLIVS
ncbi:MAG: methyltransferase domain-containing protein [Dongiaceae bacterium]